MNSIPDKIEQLISKKIPIFKINVIDESYKHKHHIKDTQGGHFKLLLISNEFKNLTLISRHQMIYNILDTMIKKEIHALSMQLLTIEEYNQK